jgi:hypothetical protein
MAEVKSETSVAAAFAAAAIRKAEAAAKQRKSGANK